LGASGIVSSTFLIEFSLSKGVVDGERPLKFPSQKILIQVFNFGLNFVLKALQDLLA
jgi:hypothetical protein